MTPTMILTADWHLRGDVPTARTDRQTYLHSQSAKRDYIFALAIRLGIPILIAGDIGHKPEWPNWLLTSFINVVLANKGLRILAIPGQHDLPEHRLDQWQNSGVGVLAAAGAIEMLVEPFNNVTMNDVQIDTAPFGVKPPEWDGGVEGRNILVCHTLLSDRKDDPNGGEYADPFIKRHDMYDLILCGDNHRTFAKQYRNTLLLSPGSLMRMSADQMGHRPACFLWYAEGNIVRPMYLPIIEGVVSREHIEVVKAKEERLSAFTERLKGAGEIKLSFEKNAEQGMAKAGVHDGVRRKVNKAIKEG
jgi:DNA repair exonuclease SbcCD nuclease subunit